MNYARLSCLVWEIGSYTECPKKLWLNYRNKAVHTLSLPFACILDIAKDRHSLQPRTRGPRVCRFWHMQQRSRVFQSKVTLDLTVSC
jgi:hypothetical protein